MVIYLIQNSILESCGFMDYKPKSYFERRSKAPLHWFKRANNARYSAFVLWKVFEDEEIIKRLAEECHYGDSPSVALDEAFLREAAVAIELIVKAVIACKKLDIPNIHNLPILWEKAELPKLNKDDQLHLHYLKSVLVWSGRYPTPKKEADWHNEQRERDAILPSPTYSGLKLSRGNMCLWPDLDRIYQIASDNFFEAYKSHKEGN